MLRTRAPGTDTLPLKAYPVTRVRPAYHETQQRDADPPLAGRHGHPKRDSPPDEDTEFNFQVKLSQLPVHVVTESEFGPVRTVGRCGFDTERARNLLRDDQRRSELLEYVGPMLAATPGFYTFLDEDGVSCQMCEAERMQVEYRIYSDGVPAGADG